MFNHTMNRGWPSLGVLLLTLVACTQTQPRPSSQSTSTGTSTGAALRTQAVAYTFYASPSGGGSSCSSGSPCSLTGARDKVRTVNGGMNGDVVVNLFGGTYALDSTLQFTQSDSGNNGNNVVWQAASGATPIVSGGQQISGWSLFDAGKNIYRASVGTLRFRQLYVAGARAIRARAPNLTDPSTGAPFFNSTRAAYPYQVNASEVGNWQNLNQVELVWRGHWAHKRARIANISVSGSTATVNLLSPEKDSALRDHAGDFYNHIFENAYELLDAEGEWYLNTSDNYVYYKPRAGENMSSVEVVAPKVERLVTLTGASGNPVHNIQFKGITFRYDNWLLPNSVGYLDVQASLGIDDGTTLPSIHYTFVPGMVQVTYGENLRFERNAFEKSGAHGLGFFQRTNGNVVIGNAFTDLSASGINFWCQDGPENALCSNDTISNNVIDSYGQAYNGAVGVFMGKSTGANIVHNEVRKGFYSGISMGWDFTDADTGSSNNQVQYNKVHDVLRLHDDGGAIYSLGRMNNTRFHHNYIYGLTQNAYQYDFSIVGFYLDNGSSFKTVDYNVVDSSPRDAFYANNDPNHDNRIENNFYSGALGTIRGTNTAQNNTPSVSSQAAIDIINCSGVESAWGGSISSSCPSGSSGGTTPPTGGITGFKKLVNKKWGSALHNTGNTYNNVSGAYKMAATPVGWNLDEQVWQITDAGGGYYKLVNKQWGAALHNTGDTYNSVSGAYELAATPVSWNLDEQLWQITDAGSGYYKLINKRWAAALHNTGDTYNSVSGAYEVATTPVGWNLDEQLWQLVAQ